MTTWSHTHHICTFTAHFNICLYICTEMVTRLFILQNGGRPQSWIFKTWNFKSLSEILRAFLGSGELTYVINSSCQISSKSVKSLRSYHDISIFKMTTACRVRFVKVRNCVTRIGSGLSLSHRPILKTELHQVVCVCWLWPWLDLLLAALRYVMYFRFCG